METVDPEAFAQECRGDRVRELRGPGGSGEEVEILGRSLVVALSEHDARDALLELGQREMSAPNL